MERKERRKLSQIASCFKNYRNVIEWWIDWNGYIHVCTKTKKEYHHYAARQYFGTYGFITELKG